MKKRCLITGAGGSIGVHVLDHLLINTDWFFVITDSYRHKGHFDRIATTLDHNPEWSKRILSITHDLTAPFTDRQIDKIGKVDYIINLASLSDVWESVADPVPSIRNNVDLVLNMLELARRTKPSAFMQFSTDEVYGPSHSDQGHPEWSTILPSNPYSASKACQEAIAIAYWRSYSVPVIITNTMNNFGQFQSASKYPVIVQKHLMAGETVDVHVTADGDIGSRHYIHSRNTADAVLFILRNLTPHLHQPGMLDRPDRYNIVGDAHLNNLELAQTIALLIGKKLKYRLVDFHTTQPGHDSHYGLDGKKLADLGWTSPVSFEDSMKATIDWQLQNPEWIER